LGKVWEKTYKDWKKSKDCRKE